MDNVCWCRAHPDRLWQQNQSGIFTDEDGAGGWKRVSRMEVEAHFGFPIAADDNDAKTAWVVPLPSDQARMTIGGGMSVTRTTVDGSRWQNFREWLPQAHCYDVIYRHALDASGDLVCFGSTTGNVYISEDRGETRGLHRQQPAADPYGALHLMTRVTFTQHLQSYFPKLKLGEEVPGSTVREVIAELEQRYPGFALYVGGEPGRLRRNVNNFLGKDPICDRETLTDGVPPGDGFPTGG